MLEFKQIRYALPQDKILIDTPYGARIYNNEEEISEIFNKMKVISICNTGTILSIKLEGIC